MKGIDIIEAMNDIDSELLLAAKRHRKAVPRWIRIVSLASCLCCAILACGIAFRCIFAQPEDTPGTAAYSSALEDTESTNSDDTEPQDSTETEAEFPSADTPDDSSDMEENLILPQDDAPDTVTIATSFTSDDSPLTDIVSLFNSHHSVQVEVVSLSDTVYTDKTNLERYAAWCDVLNEDTSIDLIVTNYLTNAALANAGYLADMSAVVDTSDLIPGLKDALMTGDCLYALPTYFWINSAYGKTEAIGEAENISFDEFLRCYGQSASLTGESFSTYIGTNMLGLFVDAAAGTCQFDSEEFRQLLSYAVSLPKEVQETASDTALRDDTAKLVNISNITDLEDLYLEETYYIDAELTFTGSPGTNGGEYNLFDCIGLTTSGSNSSGCQEFLEFLLSDEAQAIIAQQGNFPITVSGIENRYSINAANKTFPSRESDTVIDGTEYHYSPMSQEQYDKYVQWLYGISSISVFDATLLQIIEEEGQALLRGTQTVEITASNIQDRVSTYLLTFKK